MVDKKSNFPKLLGINISDFGLDPHHHQHANILDITLDFEMRT